MGIAEDIAIIVVFALICGIVAQRLRLPIILGYIFAGVLLSPHTIGPTVVNTQDVELLADIGIALLLFTVGIEFPIERLASVKKIALLGTPLQMALCIGFGLAICCGYGLPFNSGLWFGCAVSVSSTMVVLRILSDRGLTGTLSSRVMTAILIMQDLLVIPMVILLPKLSELSSQFSSMVTSLSISLLGAAAIVAVGARFMPALVSRMAAIKSRELFMVTTLALGLGLGYLTNKLGLSFAFGAFLAGIILSRSDYNHQVLSEVIPMRDLFSLIFFVSVGLLIEPAFVSNHWYHLLVLLVVVGIGKALIMGLTTRMFGYVNIMPLAVGVYMFPIGEFAFVLARLGKSSGEIPHDLYLIIVSLAAISMAMTPMVSGIVSPIYALWRKHFPSKALPAIINDNYALNGHIVVIGYGRVGRSICRIVRGRSHNLIVIESQHERFQQAKNDGFNAIGGDASSETILEAACVGTAQMVILTIPDQIVANLTLQKIHSHYPKVEVIARACDNNHLNDMLALGAHVVVVPEYEATLFMLRSAMMSTGYEDEAIDTLVNYVRRNRYNPTMGANEEIHVEEDNKIFIVDTNSKTRRLVASPPRKKDAV